MGVLNDVTDRESDRRARILLSQWCEAGDRSLGARVRERGAHAVVDEVLSGHSPLPASTGIGARVPSGTSYDAAIGRWAEPAWTAAERIGARYVVP